MYKKLLIPILLLPIIALAQHTIKGQFTPAEDFKWAILYSVTPTNALYAADTQTDSLGNFTLQLDTTATKGMYRLVYAIPQDVYNFDIIYNAEEDIELTFNEETGIQFLASEENLLLAAYQTEMMVQQGEIRNNFGKDDAKVKEAFRQLDEKQVAFEAASEGMLVQNFIKGNRTYIPEGPVDMKTYYLQTKKHYFDSIDFNNTILQSSNFLLETVFNYIQVFVAEEENVTEEFATNIDTVYSFMKNSDPAFQQAFLLELWNRFIDVEKIPTANYIASRYLIPLSKSLNNTELATQLTIFKNTSIGEKAPDFSWEEDVKDKTVSKSLYNLDEALNYILVFWSSSCSHCLTEMPQLHSKISALEKSRYKVIAIGLEDEPYDWKNSVHDFPEFTNVLGLGKWENTIGNDYGIDATPTYFILDSDKKITAKPEDIEALLKVIHLN